MKVYLGICLIILVSLLVILQCNKPTVSSQGSVSSVSSQSSQGKTNPVLEHFDTEVTLSPPFTIAAINDVDDYEHTLIFKNEGEKALTKANRDRLMSAYPMDWSTQPPSSSHFEQGLAQFKSDLSVQQQIPQTGQSPYARLEGFETFPPDTEKEILATYVPKKPQELSTYDVDDAKAIVDKIYAAKGQIADMKPSPMNENVFVISAVRKKDAPINFEEEASASKGAVTAAGEDTIKVPVVYTSENEGLDPFFTPGDLSRDGKWDYTRFTPGLERSFAPNAPMQNWY